LGIVQLLETTLLNLINFPSLIATNAARMRIAAGPGKGLLEFGLRRAQGPDGGISASKYSYLGGFAGTSNVLAGKLFQIPVKGTHAHSFVMSYTQLADLHSTAITTPSGDTVEFLALVLAKRSALGYNDTNLGELAAFVAYAQAFPAGFLALVDTYDILRSGVRNFIAVGAVLWGLGYKPLGVRIDSGDLAHFSKEIRKCLQQVDAAEFQGETVFGKCNIVASNDINEHVLLNLAAQGHEIDTFGIGTHLVTCQAQPALGCVYKLVEINGQPRIKLSADIGKTVIPGRKCVYRLSGADGTPLLDLMTMADEQAPIPGERLLVRHPFKEACRAYVRPHTVTPLLGLAFDGSLRAEAGNTGIVPAALCSLQEARARCISEMASMRPEHIQSVKAKAYKLSVSPLLYDFIHDLWMAEAPVADLN
jgi:nicotinate phosphoribosyltransferase